MRKESDSEGRWRKYLGESLPGKAESLKSDIENEGQPEDNQRHPKKGRGWNNRTSRYPLTSPAHNQDVEPPEKNPKTTKVLKKAKSG